MVFLSIIAVGTAALGTAWGYAVWKDLYHE